MGRETGIEWTDATWNPIRGCSRVSQGCVNCYAERVAARFSKPGQAYEGLAEMRVIGEGTKNERSEPHWTAKTAFIAEHLLDPTRWRKPLKIFVNSMSDLFHESIPDEWIHQIFDVMQDCPRHTFQILTKRPERMRDFVEMRAVLAKECGEDLDGTRIEPLLPNVWLGVSVEDQKTADERIPLLLDTPAAVRFISYEPALGPVDLNKILCPCLRPVVGSWTDVGSDRVIPYTFDEKFSAAKYCAMCKEHGRLIKGGGLHWVICGGESGIGARPMHPDWARTVRDQCQAAGVAFFFKQWGEWMPAGGEKTIAQHKAVERAKKNPKRKHVWPDRSYSVLASKKITGCMLDLDAHREFPAVQSSAGPSTVKGSKAAAQIYFRDAGKEDIAAK